MKIIITDLTRFANQDIVCIAGINPDTNECIRPRPYVAKEDCQKRNILPGAIIEGEFTPYHYTAPHTEDRNRSLLTFCGPCRSEEFKNLLKTTSVNSVEEGFGIQIPDGQKYIHHDAPPMISIITLLLTPDQFNINKNKFNELRASFTDCLDRSFHFLSVTDLGVFEYAERYADDYAIDKFNNFIHAQDDLYIRLGLSRRYKSYDGRDGFWLQVNGIYTFPEYLKEVRCYA